MINDFTFAQSGQQRTAAGGTPRVIQCQYNMTTGSLAHISEYVFLGGITNENRRIGIAEKVTDLGWRVRSVQRQVDKPAARAGPEQRNSFN
jgi:hypothetical protein